LKASVGEVAGLCASLAQAPHERPHDNQFKDRWP